MNTNITNFTSDGRQATRFDVAGNPIDAHDGDIRQFGGVYYLYGTSYDCGYQWQDNDTFCGFKVYSSPDLRTWTDHGYVVSARACGYCFRPHVVYNIRTRQYVMWANDQAAMDNYRVYTASSPLGPFTEAPVPDLPTATPCTADLGLFVDKDATGYLTCSNAGWHVAVLKLTSDYLQPTGQYAVLGVTRVEAPTLFERNGTYYLTMSDPNCGYCAATGTSYATAPTPLGPWHGTDSWIVKAGKLAVNGALYGLSKSGAGWADYTFSADVTPITALHSTTAQAGWSVRMNSSDQGYLFELSGKPKANGTLTVMVRNGTTVRSHAVPLPCPVTSGVAHHVAVTAAGTTFSTSIDGRKVDTFSDSTYAVGGVGFREFNGVALERAYFDNARVVASNGANLLADNFSSPNLTAWVPPLSGTKISTNSCGGQPADVATLTGADGRPVYLYFSDLWGAHSNEALANYFWTTLQFDAHGAIQPLRCTNSSVFLSGHAGTTSPVLGQDQSSGSAAFAPSCAVRAGQSYGQSFIVSRTGQLTSVAVNVYRDGTEPGRGVRNPANGPLLVQLATLLRDGTPGATLWSTTVQPEEIGWSARLLQLQPNLPVQLGEHLALVLSTDSWQGCYGIETDPTNPYAPGSALAGSNRLTLVNRTDLKFWTTVGPSH